MTWAHICVDMQRLFADRTPWHTPWMKRIVPEVRALVAAHPGETIFTRFIPARRPQDATGAWRTFYERWASVTLDRLDDALIELVPELRSFVPPATVVDKSVYSPWFGTALQTILSSRHVDTVVVSGGETDVCVLATVLGAVDLGYHVIIAKDALCSSRDDTHEALVALYEKRFHEQMDARSTADILAAWNASD